MELNHKKRSSLFFPVAAILIWIYVLLRAKFLAITWDEAYSFDVIVQNNRFFPDHFDVMAANNHYLNSILMWISWKIFGNGEFILRIPSLIGCAIYLFFVLKFISRLQSFSVRLFAFALFCLNPFILDFLGLARGYCLALAFMMAACWYLFSYVKEGSLQWKLLLSLFFSALTLTANLSWTTFFIAHVIVVLLLQLHAIVVKKHRSVIFPAIISVLFSSGVILAAGWLEMQYEKASALGFGTYDGIWNGTVQSLLDGFFYLRHYAYAFETFMRSVIIVFILLSLISVIVHLQDERWRNWNKSFILILFLVFILLITGLEFLNIFFGVKFVSGRTAFPLLVVFCLMSVFTADGFISETFRKLTIVVPTLFLIGHFCFCINLHITFDWYKGADVKNAIAAIEQDLQRRPEQREHNVRIGTDLSFFSALDYYDNINHYTWLSEKRFLYDRVDPDLRFFVAAEETFSIFRNKPEWKVLEYYPEEKAALYYNTAYVSPKE